MKVSIIGAGIAGLSLALCLQRLGLDYELFEAAPELKSLGAGIVLSPNAMYIFDQLGLKEALEQAASPLTEFEIASARGQSLRVIANETVLHGKPYQSLGIHRAALQHLLSQHLDSSKLHLGHAFTKLEPTTKTIHFENRASSKIDYLVAADGIHSKIRQTLFPQTKLRYSGQTCWRGIAPRSSNLSVGRAKEFWGKATRFGYVPIGSGQTYWYATAVRPAGQLDESVDLSTSLSTLYQDYPEPILQILKDTPSSSFIRHDLYDLYPLRSWHYKNIVFIGDAAHAMTPNLGQGAAQGIEDAWVLSHFLSKTAHFQEAFAHYETLRMPKAQQVVKLSWQIGKLANLDHPLLCFLRDQAFIYTPKAWSINQRQKLYFVPELP